MYKSIACTDMFFLMTWILITLGVLCDIKFPYSVKPGSRLQIDAFPQPVYKKFETREEAEKYVESAKPARVECALFILIFDI